MWSAVPVGFRRSVVPRPTLALTPTLGTTCRLPLSELHSARRRRLVVSKVAVNLRVGLGTTEKGTDFSYQGFSCTNLSSLFALIATAVMEFKQQGVISEQVAYNFVRIRLLLDLDASPDDILVTNHQENSEQHERKRHTELDNIDAVSVWRQQLVQLPESGLKADSVLDVFKYAASLGDRNGKPAWLLSDLAKVGKSTNSKDILAILTDKDFTRKVMDSRKIVTTHPQIKNYSDLVLTGWVWD
jgi:hypothetical protein